MTYAEKLKDPRWQKKRLEILERDQWCCQSCYNGENTLHVHHKYYLPKTDPWGYPDDAFITLCEDCHERERDTRGEYEQMLLQALKHHFLADDLYRLVNGFLKYKPPHASEVAASILEWALSDSSIQKALCTAFFESIKKKPEAEK